MANAMEIVQIRAAQESTDAFLATRSDAVEALRAFPGFVSAHLAQIAEDRWIDVVLWASREEAIAAAEQAARVLILTRHFAHFTEVACIEQAEIRHETAA